MATIVAILDIGTVLAILNLDVPSIRHSIRKEMSFEEFQDGCHGSHLGYQN